MREKQEILCGHCGCVIYDGDIICNLNEVYGEGDFIVHEECLTDSLSDNKPKALEYIFEDLSVIFDLFDGLLSKYTAWEYFERIEEDE